MAFDADDTGQSRGGEAVSDKTKPWVIVACCIAYAVAVLLGWIALEKVFPVTP